MSSANEGARLTYEEFRHIKRMRNRLNSKVYSTVLYYVNFFGQSQKPIQKQVQSIESYRHNRMPVSRRGNHIGQFSPTTPVIPPNFHQSYCGNPPIQNQPIFKRETLDAPFAQSQVSRNGNFSNATDSKRGVKNLLQKIKQNRLNIIASSNDNHIDQANCSPIHQFDSQVLNQIPDSNDEKQGETGNRGNDSTKPNQERKGNEIFQQISDHRQQMHIPSKQKLQQSRNDESNYDQKQAIRPNYFNERNSAFNRGLVCIDRKLAIAKYLLQNVKSSIYMKQTFGFKNNNQANDCARSVIRWSIKAFKQILDTEYKINLQGVYSYKIIEKMLLVFINRRSDIDQSIKFLKKFLLLCFFKVNSNEFEVELSKEDTEKALKIFDEIYEEQMVVEAEKLRRKNPYKKPRHRRQ